MKNNKYNDFRDLEVWQKCRELRKNIWELCKTFPKEERYRLSDQMIRASGSAPANIAEGYGRYHYQENIQFCRQARGALYELIDHVEVAVECGYFDQETTTNLFDKIQTAVRLLNGYVKYLKTRKEEG